MITKAASHFRSLFMRLAAALVLIAAGLFILSAVSGPRLRHTQVDTILVANQPNQRVILQANQPLDKIQAKDVHIKPAVAFTVLNNASTISITFKQRLAYGTAYTITVNNVVAQYGQKRSATFHSTFTTYTPVVYYLKRGGTFARKAGSPAVDQIVQANLTNTKQRVVYTVARIQAFALLDKTMIVSTMDTEGISSLYQVDLTSHSATSVVLPGKGQIDQLHSSADGTFYGFRLSSDLSVVPRLYENNVFVQDTSPGHRLVPLEGISGDPLKVLDWKFAPDNSSAVAQTYDTALLLIDLNFNHQPVPLGQFLAMGNFAAGGTQIIVRNRADFVALDLITRKRAAVQPELLSTATAENQKPLSLAVQFLSNQSGFVSQVQVSYEQGKRFDNFIVLSAGKTQRTLYQVDILKENLTSYHLSSNDQYLIVEHSRAAGTYDAYPDTSLPLQTKSELIDTTTGKTMAVFDGSNLLLR